MSEVQERVELRNEAENRNVGKNNVTHIEIIKSKKCKFSKMIGSNQIVPLNTSMWQNGKLQDLEPSICATYKSVLEDIGCVDNRYCCECKVEFISATQLKHHIQNFHQEQKTTLQQCFFCKRKYVFAVQLSEHLLSAHGIRYPDTTCHICFMEFNSVVEKKAHQCKHNSIYPCMFCKFKFAGEYEFQLHYDKHLLIMKPFECCYCGKRFHTSFMLAFHEKRHKFLKCEFCDHRFAGEVIFLKHLKTHGTVKENHFLNGIEKYDQEESKLEKMLDLYFEDKRSAPPESIGNIDGMILHCLDDVISSVCLINKIETKDASNVHDKFTCCVCSVPVTTAELLSHARSAHPRNKVCLLCGQRSKSVSTAQRHLEFHLRNVSGLKQTKPNDIECSGCHKTSQSNGKCSYHFSVVHKVNKMQRSYSCICPRKFKYEANFRRHMRYIHGENSCKSIVCGTNEQQKHAPLEHNKLVDGGEETSSCKLPVNSASDGKSFKSCAEICSTAINSDETSGDLRCNICNKLFLQRKALLKHKVEHTVDYKCNVCGKSFSTSRKLKLHSKSHTDSKRRFKCNMCTVACPTASGLRVHKRTHTGERPYHCDKCHARFSRIAALKKHTMTVHEVADSFVYSCRECEAGFRVRGNLVRHYLSVHQKLRRFICGLCGWRHSQNQDLRRHLLQKHQVEGSSILGADKKPLNEIYVLPSIDRLPPSDPLLAKIKAVVEKEKSKFKEVEELLFAVSTNKWASDSCESLVRQPVKLPLSKEVLGQPQCLSSRTNKTTQTCGRIVEVEEDKQATENLDSAQATSSQSRCPQDSLACALQQKEVDECTSVRATHSSREHGHLRSVSESALRCSLCGQWFCTEEEFSDHMRREKPLPCSFCGRQFCGNASLQSHLREKHVMVVYRCGVCLADHAEQSLLTLHMMKVHGISPHSQQSSSLAVQGGPVQFPPRVCPQNALGVPVMVGSDGRLFLQTSVLAQPIAPSFPSQISLAHESQCLNPSNTVSLGRLGDDMLQSPLPFQSCPVEYCDIEEFIHMHKNDTASEVTVLDTHAKVPTCPTDIPTNQDALPPKLSHWSASEKFSCRLCDKQFGSLELVEKHSIDHSTDVRPYKCLVCGKCFKEKGNLKVHMRSHTGERPYHCDICNRRMRYQKELVEHKRMHDGSTPYSCEQCGRKFSRHRVLVRHRQTHSPVKKYKCSVCDKAFSRLDQLKLNHMPTHLADKEKLQEFACSACEKSFMLKSKLNQHQILHSGKHAQSSKDHSPFLFNTCSE